MNIAKGGANLGSYPDWVNSFKTKGTAVKKVGGSYYLYSSTSRRVPGKKNPQPSQKFIGAITPEGVAAAKSRMIAGGKLRVFEYGFSLALQKLLPEKFMKDIGGKEKARDVFLNVARSYSPESYLLRGVEVPRADELRVCLSTQKKKYERLVKESHGVEMAELEPLKYLRLAEFEGFDMLSDITGEMAGIFEKIGVKDYGLPQLRANFPRTLFFAD